MPGPLVVGALRPRILLPLDFEARHAPDEARLVIAHERAHLARGDTRAQLVAVALRCLQWFNPFLHLAGPAFRLDQELACDASVLARHPHARRRYADAMLNVQLAVPGLPVGCHWQSSQSLKERILMLKQPQPGARRRRMGLVVLGLVLGATSYTAWAVRPAPSLDVPAPPTAPMAPEAPPAPPVAPAPLPPAGPKHWRARTPPTPRSPWWAAPPFPAAPNSTRSPMAWSAARSARKVSRPSPSTAVPAPPAPPPVLSPPRYPSDAAAAGRSGRVVLKVLVGTDGRAKDIVVEQSEPAGVFEASTLEAARDWVFQPAMEGGRAVEGWVRVPVDFEAPTMPAPAAGGGA